MRTAKTLIRLGSLTHLTGCIVTLLVTAVLLALFLLCYTWCILCICVPVMFDEEFACIES